MDASSLHLRLSDDLAGLLKRPWRGQTGISLVLDRRASIKDIIEALGIPHTEIWSLRLDGREIDFSHIPAAGERLILLGPVPPADPCRPTRLRPQPVAAIRFLVDRNAGRLAKLLRMAGLDAELVRDLPPGETAALAADTGRILLSRDREVLKRCQVIHGRLIRAEEPEDQLDEIITLYGLAPVLRPWSRCMVCNTPLRPVAREKILHRLQPLTRRYYRDFSLCGGCGRIYWRGSHYRRMRETLERIAGGGAAGAGPVSGPRVP